MPALVLGTAQFGADYGVTNATGRLSNADVDAVMAFARANGIAQVDTAAGYGDAQVRLRPYAHDLVITTKVAGAEPTGLHLRIEAALAELGVEAVDSCLLHDWHALGAATRGQAARGLEAARAAGLVGAVGVSGYEEADLVSALDAFERLDIVQIPANVLDRRLDGSPALARLGTQETRIQVRSIFLQGLLAGPSDAALAAHPDVVAFHEACARDRSAPLVVALAHARSLPWASEVVVGVGGPGQLEELWHAWQEPATRADPTLASADLDLLDPRRW